MINQSQEPRGASSLGAWNGPGIGRVSWRGIESPPSEVAGVAGLCALSDAVNETRDRLVGLLWSESTEERARASLRQTLQEIRRGFAQIGFDGLRISTVGVAIDRSRLRVDVWELVQAAEAGRADPRLLQVMRLPETLIADFDNLDPAFRIWLLARRQTLHDRLVRAFESRLREFSDASPEAEDLATAILNLDPTHEEACRFLIGARRDRGDLAGALRIYKTLWELLEAEYDIEPSPQTQQLIIELRNAQAQPGVPGPGFAPAVASSAKPPARLALLRAEQPTPPEKVLISVAVFDSAAVNPAKAHLVRGFRHELIACLVRFREWYVCDEAQPAAAQPPDRTTVPEYAVQTSASESEDAVRLTVTLRDARTGVYVWGDRYRLTLANWFEAQQAIVRRMASELNVHLSAERLTQVSREQDTAMHGYDLWLRGEALVDRYNAADWERAMEILRGITNDVPSFSPAYSSLVRLQNSAHLVYPGLYRDREREHVTLDLAKTAARLDPLDSRAQLCLGWAYAMAKQYDQAEVNLALAYQLNENDPWTLTSAAHGSAFLGRYEHAFDIADQALRLLLVPSRIHWGYQVGIRFLLGDYERCVEAADRAETIILNLPGWKASALYHLGRREEAAAEARQFLRLIHERWVGQEAPSEEAILRWFLHLFPIKKQDDWERLRAGLAGIGLAVDHLRHHEW
jgi:DNA-binding SARP family transcriptional activator/TolB-like protein